MVNKYKRLNAIQIISLLIMIITYILQLFKIDNMDSLFWVGVGLNMLGILLFNNKWGKEGTTWYKNLDKNYDKNLTRKPSDTMFFIIIGYFIVICLIILNDLLVMKQIFSSYNMLSLLGQALIWNYVLLVIVDKTSKEVKTMILEYENKLNKKGKTKNGNK